jgi:superfamily II DNA helicase RecQ
LLISDGVVEEFVVTPADGGRKKKAVSASDGNKGNGRKRGENHGQTAALELTPQAQALAERLREWRTAEAKRLRVLPYVVLHDRTLTEMARVRPRNPNQLLAIDGIGSAKVEKFGAAILDLCGTEDH